MAKKHERVIKAVEKYRKHAFRELERARFLLRKCSDLASDDSTRAAVEQLVERLKQRELQLSGDGVWADQLAAQLRAALDKAEPAGEKEKKAKKAKKPNKVKLAKA